MNGRARPGENPVSACGCAQPGAASLWRWGRIAFSGVLAVNAMAVALAVNTSGASASNPQAIWLGLLSVTLLVGGMVGTPLLAGAWDALRQRRLAVEFLFLLTLAGAFGVSVQSLWRGEGPVYFEVVCLLLVVYSFGAELNRAARDRAVEALRALSASERVARVRREDGTVVDLTAGAVPLGSRVEVLPGEMVPVDGTLIGEPALFEEATLRGEFVPRSRAPGETVPAGSFVVDTLVLLRAVEPLAEASLDALVCEVRERLDSRSEAERAADRLARWFVPVVASTAGATLLGWSFFVPWPEALFHAMAVLLVACPCALGFATPLALWTAVSRLNRIGLRVSRAADIEKLAAVNAVAFDKTGTLSAAEARVDEILWEAGLQYPAATMGRILAAAEDGLRHPYARALSRGAWGKASFDDGESGAWHREGLRILPGRGIQARMRSDDGTLHELEITGCTGVPGSATEGSADEAQPGIAVTLDGCTVGWARFEEAFRNGRGAALAGLDEMGIAVRLLSGDDPMRARRAGIAAAEGNQTPSDKREAVLEWQASGKRVLFVGDGINDAPAMAEADAAIALDEGTALARAVAGIVWDGARLEAIPAALRIARQTLGRVQANFRWALGYNLIGMALAAAGVLHPVTAALLMVASSAQVTWRALALLDENFEENSELPMPVSGDATSLSPQVVESKKAPPLRWSER